MLRSRFGFGILISSMRCFPFLSRPLIPASVLAFVVLFLQGCGIASYVGDFISRTYDNTVAYFNIYYNASRIFSEAEQELAVAERVNRAKGLPSLAQTGAPTTIKQKFNVVIDKCSNILAFHQESALVDDALFLIGKSYFYQGEYVKAERKFAELIAQYPTSNVRLEADLWLLRCMAMLNRPDDVIQQAPELVANAASHADVVGEMHRVLAGCYEKKNDVSKALEHYQKAIDILHDEEARSEARKSLADLLFQSGAYKQAAAEYLKMSAATGDTYLEYFGLLQAARCYRLSGMHDEALRLVEEVQDNFRFNQYLDAILLERARILAARGDFVDAVEEYAYVDTVYSKTEAGARAAFERAQILEEKLGDYSAAWVAYARAGAGQVAEISIAGRRKSSAFNSYFETHTEVGRLDSLLRGGAGETVDSANQPVLTDGARDSLRQLRAKAFYKLGELFYSELNRPDSSVSYYLEALRIYRDSSMTPRALFVLADLARSFPKIIPQSSVDWYGELVREYPSSPYAQEARRILGQGPTHHGRDPAEEQYAVIENKIIAGRYREALGELRELARTYPLSPVAAKSLYAIGWIYEHHLAKPDSALRYYKLLLDSYSGTLYASAVKGKVTPMDGVAQPDTSVVKQNISPQQPAVPVREDDDVRSGRRQQSNQSVKKKDDKREDQ